MQQKRNRDTATDTGSISQNIQSNNGTASSEVVNPTQQGKLYIVIYYHS